MTCGPQILNQDGPRGRRFCSRTHQQPLKTRNDGEILYQANNNVPTSDPFWTGFSFTWDDVWFTRDQELKANYPTIRSQLPE